MRHMWPLTITPPRCREAYVIVAYDKYCSMMETLRKDVMELELLGTPVSLPVPVPRPGARKAGLNTAGAESARPCMQKNEIWRPLALAGAPLL